MRFVLGFSLYLLSACTLAGQALKDEYYSNDIFMAIEEAKVRTHHYDYSSALRYNRSTSQSIQIPRLLNKDMEQTSIETPDLEQNAGKPSPGAENKLANNNDSGRLSVGSTGSASIEINNSAVTVRAYLTN